MNDDEPIELAETISHRELDARLGRYRRSDTSWPSWRMDMADVIATLPDELRDLAERLQDTERVGDRPRMGIPRTTLNESVRRICGNDSRRRV